MHSSTQRPIKPRVITRSEEKDADQPGITATKTKRLKRRSTAHEEQPKKKEKKKEKIYCSANAKKSLPFQEDPKRKEG